MMFATSTLKKDPISAPLPYHLLPWLILSIDFFGFLVSQVVAVQLLTGSPLRYLSPLWLSVFALSVAGFYLFNTYHPESESSQFAIVSRTALSGVSSLLLSVVVIAVFGMGNSGYPFWQQESRLLLSIFLLTFWSALWRLWMTWQLGEVASRSRWIILASQDKVKDVLSFFECRYNRAEVIFLTDDPEIKKSLRGTRFLVKGYLEDFKAPEMPTCSGLLVDPHLQLSDTLLKDLMLLRLRGTKVYSLPEFFEHFWTKVPPATLVDNWFAFTSGFILLHNQIYPRIKRLSDVILAGSLLLLLSPIMLLSAIAIRLDSRGPIFYSQVRTGLNQCPFRVKKFRSMYQDAESRGAQWASERDPRITRVGRFMRATRIDELPQLINVLLGSMSMMGPRPERPEFDRQLEQEIPYYNIRYLVRPGITGWAQVMYPYGASVEDAYEKFSYDLYYLKNYSLLLDLRIVLMTVRVVLFGKGR
jgi:exopolysaccharide biosynthesis polyprenyl glycosylphosphotransferase